MSDPSMTTTIQGNARHTDGFQPDASAVTTIADLRSRFGDAPFLALGQTALWDEPTKATLRKILDSLWPDARLIAAAHDTDYFAKLPGHPPAREHGKYAIVSHDDARTRGLWSAAGEMSRLFGSEDVPTCALLESEGGVSLHRALAGADDPSSLLSELTSAWGWTGIIYTHWDRKISRDVPLADIALALADQTAWALDGSADLLSGARAQAARGLGNRLRDGLVAYAEAHPGASLTDLYRDLYPRMYELLMGAPASNLETSSTTQLLRLNRETANRPRFGVVELFLNPITRRIALDAYNLAVGGSDIYTLDRFGDGAIPFDLVIPGRGRGTLCIPGDGKIYVDTPQPIILCDEGCDFSSMEKLADLVERELGSECALVGKAVTLLPMLAAEYIIVFHESASGYSDRTNAMMAHFARRHIVVPELKPILRLKYGAWDALEAVPDIGSETDPANSLRLPEFLAQAFGRETIPIREFGACWRCAVEKETERLARLAVLCSPRDLLNHLAVGDPTGVWTAKAKAYDSAGVQLMRIRDQAQAIQGRVYTFYDQIRAEKATLDRLERAKGDDFRARIQPLRDRIAASKDPGEIETLTGRIAEFLADRATLFDFDIVARRSQVRYSLAYVRDLKEKRLTLERGAVATAARATLREIEAEAEIKKARLVRNALQTVRGLPHTNFRPSAWWLPLVDPTGSWFRRIAETAELRLEPLTPPS